MATLPQRFERIAKESLPEKISRMLKEKILHGQFRPGDRLVESLIATQLQVGQNTVREALQILEHQSLVTKIPRVGTFVTELTEREVDQVYQVRVELEAIAVKLATENGDDPCFEKLERLAGGITSAAKAGDWARVVRTDLEFHQTIWALSGNRFLEKALLAVTEPLFAYLLVKHFPSGPQKMLSNTECHLRLLEMMKRGDAQGAYESAKQRLQELRIATLHDLTDPEAGARGD